MVYVILSLAFGLSFILSLEDTWPLQNQYYISAYILGTPGFTQCWLDVPVSLPL